MATLMNKRNKVIYNENIFFESVLVFNDICFIYSTFISFSIFFLNLISLYLYLLEFI
jgi:hypothetical protein